MNAPQGYDPAHEIADKTERITNDPGAIAHPGVPFEHGRYWRDGGDTMGDYARGITPTRRFAQLRADGTFTVITESAAAVLVGEESDTPRVYRVENETEFMHCRDLDDVGGSELDCDYLRESVPGDYFTNLREAERAAARFIRGLSIEHYGWDAA